MPCIDYVFCLAREKINFVNLCVLFIPHYLPIYGKEKARLKKEGLLLPDFDLLISITSVHNNLILVSNNTRHMSRVQGVRLETWIP